MLVIVSQDHKEELEGIGDVLRTELIIARHGFASAWFGLRTRKLGRGGRRIGCNFVLAPFGGILNSSPV